MISYMSIIDSQVLNLITNELLAILSLDLEDEIKGQIQGHEKICHIKNYGFSICPQLNPEALKSIIHEILAILSNDLENEVKFKVTNTFAIYDSLYVNNLF